MLKDKIKQNAFLHPIFRLAKKILVKCWVKICCVWSAILVKPSEKMLKFKDKHHGERCFIVCTGPSLTMEDLDMIKDEVCFSMNSIINIFERTDFRPTYYLIQDGYVERKLRNKILEQKKDFCRKMFIGVGNVYLNKLSTSNRAFKKYRKWNPIRYNLNWAYHCYEMYYESDRIEFSMDCAKEIKDGYTVTYSAIQLAIYMGFKEIYLLGCDSNFAGHIDEVCKQDNVAVPALAMIKAYKIAKKYADRYGVKIYNATRGGMLEVFPRVALEEVVK